MNAINKKRCIIIFPEFENINIINKVRDKYDPLAEKVKPHITLVFPFESNINKIQLHKYLMESINDIKCFNLILNNIIKINDKTGLYLFLEVKKGTNIIKQLHNRLYDGMLETYKPKWLNEIDYMPHMTIGNFSNSIELNNAYKDVSSKKDEFNTLIDKISVEIIADNEESIIEMEVNLSK